MRWTIWLRISSAFGANDDLALIEIKAGYRGRSMLREA